MKGHTLKLTWIPVLALVAIAAVSETPAQSGWFPVPTGSASILRSLFCVSSTTVYVCGADGIIARTTNGGDIWSTTVLGGSSSFSDTLFTRGGTGYVSGYNKYPDAQVSVSSIV